MQEKKGGNQDTNRDLVFTLLPSTETDGRLDINHRGLRLPILLRACPW